MKINLHHRPVDKSTIPEEYEVAISPKNFISDLEEKKGDMSDIHPLAFHFCSSTFWLGKNGEYS